MYKPFSAESATGTVHIAGACDLALLRTRYYNPTIGQFTSFDEFEAEPADVQHQHKYSYAGADPVNSVDPSGHDFFGLTGQLFRAGIDAFGRGILLVGGFLVRRAALTLVRTQIAVYQTGLRVGVLVASGAGASLRIGQGVMTRLQNPGSLGPWANQLTPNMLRQLAVNPTAQRFVDQANNGRVQVIQRLPGLSNGQLFRITFDHIEVDKMISIGQLRATQVAQWVSNGRYVSIP
ncbi:MAG: RHS repeat-associated core domain-containing protein [Tepidisphaeraceae bacterium]